MANEQYIEIARIRMVVKGGKPDRGAAHTANDLLKSFFEPTPYWKHIQLKTHEGPDERYVTIAINPATLPEVIYQTAESFINIDRSKSRGFTLKIEKLPYAVPAFQSHQQSQPTSLDARVKELEAELAGLREMLVDIHGESSRIREQHEKTKILYQDEKRKVKRLQETERKYEALQKKYEETETKLKESKAQRIQAEEDLKTLREETTSFWSKIKKAVKKRR